MEHRFIAKKYWEETENVFGTIAEKIKDIDDCINFSIGDPDLTTNVAITEAAFKDALNGHTKYTHIRGYVELRDEIRKFYAEEYNMQNIIFRLPPVYGVGPHGTIYVDGIPKCTKFRVRMPPTGRTVQTVLRFRCAESVFQDRTSAYRLPLRRLLPLRKNRLPGR